MIVCHCKGVTDRTIRKAVREGASTLQELSSHCGAATGCGGCAEAVVELLPGESLARGEAPLPAASNAQPHT